MLIAAQKKKHQTLQHATHVFATKHTWRLESRTFNFYAGLAHKESGQPESWVSDPTTLTPSPSVHRVPRLDMIETLGFVHVGVASTMRGEKKAQYRVAAGPPNEKETQPIDNRHFQGDLNFVSFLYLLSAYFPTALILELDDTTTTRQTYCSVLSPSPTPSRRHHQFLLQELSRGLDRRPKQARMHCPPVVR